MAKNIQKMLILGIDEMWIAATRRYVFMSPPALGIILKLETTQLSGLNLNVCHSEAKPKNLGCEIEILHYATLRSEWQE